MDIADVTQVSKMYRAIIDLTPFFTVHIVKILPKVQIYPYSGFVRKQHQCNLETKNKLIGEKYHNNKTETVNLKIGLHFRFSLHALVNMY